MATLEWKTEGQLTQAETSLRAVYMIGKRERDGKSSFFLAVRPLDLQAFINLEFESEAAAKAAAQQHEDDPEATKLTQLERQIEQARAQREAADKQIADLEKEVKTVQSDREARAAGQTGAGETGGTGETGGQPDRPPRG